jgi:hypothetical protein
MMGVAVIGGGVIGGDATGGGTTAGWKRDVRALEWAAPNEDIAG